jgi:membrane peptidoglycan carboxypeptidase
VASDSRIPLDDGREVAAKTGTHQLGDTGENSAAWTVGYTPSISSAVWVGDPANSAIKDENGNDIFGRGVPGAIWQQFMDSYLAGTPKETFPPFKPIAGKAGPAADQIAPPTKNREVTAPTRTVEPTPTPTPEPEPTQEPEPTEETRQPERCTLFSCDTPTEPPGDSGGGGGSDQPPGGGGGFPGTGGGDSNNGRSRGF